MQLPTSRFNGKLIINTMAIILLIEGVAMLPSTLLAVFDGDRDVAVSLGMASIILLALAFAGKTVVGKHHTRIKAEESYFIVISAWLTAIVGGMVPYLLAGRNYGLINSFFESSANWTTTNAWVVDVNALPRALVLWKAISSWLGGMGIILLTIVVFSALGVGGQKLAGVEIAGPELEKHTAKMTDTAKLLYILYGAGSLIEVMLLKLAGLPLFDAVINTMSTISTAGTIDYHGVLSQHFTPFIKIIIAIFSILASLNFAIYIKIIKKKTKEALMDFEMHLFMAIIIVSTLLVAIILLVKGQYHDPVNALINALTGVVSFSCTTGFTLERVELWPSACKFIFILLMMIGGCSTSTAGGIKVIRAGVLVKLINRGVYKRIHPRAVKPVMIKDVPVSTTNATSISTFTLLFLGVYVLSALILSLENLDMETTLTAPIALFSNCGMGFSQVSSANFAIFSAMGRLYCALLMIVGRLEIYAVLILFSRSFWNPNRKSA